MQKFSPALGPRNFITVEGARTDGKMAFSLGLFGNYGRTRSSSRAACRTPLPGGGRSSCTTVTVVETVITGDLLASLTVFPRLQLGVRVPYTFAKGLGLTTDPTSTGFGQHARAGSRDRASAIRCFEAKVRASIGSATDRHVLGVSVFGTAPVAHSSRPPKTRSSATRPRRRAGAPSTTSSSGRFSVGANLGGAYRKEAFARLGSARIGASLRRWCRLSN